MVSFRRYRGGLLLLLAALCPPLQPFQAAPAEIVPSGPLPASETLQYTVEWRLVTAGKMRIDFNAGEKGFQTKVHLESSGLISRFFKLQDQYSSTLDIPLCAHSSFFQTHEGSRQRETSIAFDPARKKASYIERDTAKNA